MLTILLALVIHSGSRKRIMLVGTTFLIVTAAIYGLFIAGVFGSLAFLLALYLLIYLAIELVIFTAALVSEPGVVIERDHYKTLLRQWQYDLLTLQ